MASSEPQSCHHCGCTQPFGPTGGLCPACLFRCVLDGDDSDPGFTMIPLSPLDEAGGRLFGRYELFEVVGRGSMGIVYRARERTTGRFLALKLATAAQLGREDFRERFHAEVKAAARLDHPHILPIHEVGEYDGIPFFTMKLAEGGSLAGRVEHFRGHPREAANFVAKVARAVDHAHARGLLHRDIKPANILIDAAGEPYVGDFGLVKWIEADAGLTASTTIVGAPGYLAPEQANPDPGQPLDARADVFSLGVILYELLTGCQPFAAATLWETLDRVARVNCTRVRHIERTTPRALEIICHHCLQLDPSGRYSTAAALADDLDRWVHGRTIRARPAGPWAKTWSWTRRNPWLAGLSLTVLALLVIAAIGSTASAIVLAQSRDRALHAEHEAREQLWQSLLAEARAQRTSGEIGRRSRAIASLQDAAAIRFAPELRDEAIEALMLTDLRLTREWTTEVAFGCFSSDLAYYACERSDGSCEVRRTSDHATLATFPTPVEGVYGCWRFSPDDRTVSVLGREGVAWLWNWREATVVKIPFWLPEAPVCAEFSPDGAIIALTAEGGGIALFNRLGEPVKVICPEIAHPWALVFSPDGGAIAVSDRRRSDVLVVDVESGHVRTRFEHAQPVSSLAYSPDGRWLAAGSTDSEVTLWFLPRGIAHKLSGHSRLCDTLVFSPDSRMLISSGYDQTVRLWEVSTQLPLAVMTAANAAIFFDHTASRLGTATEDGRWAVFDLLTNRVLTTLVPDPSAVTDETVSMDVDDTSRLIAVGGWRGIRLFDARSAEEVDYLHGAGVGRHDVAFAPKSSALLASVGDGGLFSWERVSTEAEGLSRPRYSDLPTLLKRGAFRLAAVGPQQHVIALADIDGGVVHLLPFGDPRASQRSFEHPSVRAIAFDPEGKWILAGGWKSPRVSLWKLPELLHHEDFPTSQDASFAFSHDGRAAIIGKPGAYQIFETGGWAPTHSLSRSAAPLVTSYLQTAAGVPVAACQWTNRSLRLLDLASGEWLATLPVTVRSGLSSFCLNADGSALVVAGERQVVQRWDLEELVRELSLLGLGWEAYQRSGASGPEHPAVSTFNKSGKY